MTERERPAQGSFYRHFKGKLYQIKDIAIHSETGEEMVVYQAMYPPFGTWVRPLGMFLEEVDHVKYPEVKQKYRFVKVQILDNPVEKIRTSDSTEVEYDEVLSDDVISGHVLPIDMISEEEWKEILINNQVEKKLADNYSKEEIAQRGMMTFLDAKNLREKRDIFVALQQVMDKRFLSNIAVALDITLEEGSIEEQYDAILYCIDKWEQYEGGRLRR